MANPQSLRKSVGFSAVGALGAQGITFIGMLILARLLSPHEFGLMAVVAIFTALAVIFVDMGMGAALVHRSDLTAKHCATAFWFNLGMSLLFMVGLQYFSSYLASFFKEDNLESVLFVASWLFPLNAISIVPMALLQKSQDFQKTAWVELLSVSSGFITALVLAMSGAGVWALIANLFVVGGVRAVTSLLAARWLPLAVWDKNSFLGLWSYSGYLFGAGIVNYFIANIDSVLVGRSFGTQVLGMYKYAFQVANIPTSVVNGVLSRVFFASYATYKDDQERIKNLHLKVIQLVAFLVFPCMLTLAPLSDVFVVVFLGEKWVGMSDILAFMCIIFLLDSIGTMSGSLFLSQGKTKTLFWLNLTLRSNQLVAMLIGVQFGLEGLLWSLLLVRMINFYPVYYVVGKTVGFSVADVGKKIFPVLLSSILIAIEVWWARSMELFQEPSLWMFSTLSLLALVSYIILMSLLQREVLQAFKLAVIGK